MYYAALVGESLGWPTCLTLPQDANALVADRDEESDYDHPFIGRPPVIDLSCKRGERRLDLSVKRITGISYCTRAWNGKCSNCVTGPTTS